MLAQGLWSADTTTPHRCLLISLGAPSPVRALLQLLGLCIEHTDVRPERVSGAGASHGKDIPLAG